MDQLSSAQQPLKLTMAADHCCQSNIQSHIDVS